MTKKKVTASKFQAYLTDTAAKVESGALDVKRASVISNLMRTHAKATTLRIEHAKATGRLKQGSNRVPDFTEE